MVSKHIEHLRDRALVPPRDGHHHGNLDILRLEEIDCREGSLERALASNRVVELGGWAFKRELDTSELRRSAQAHNVFVGDEGSIGKDVVVAHDVAAVEPVHQREQLLAPHERLSTGKREGADAIPCAKRTLHLSEDGQEVAQWHFVRRGVRLVIAMSAALITAFGQVPLEVELVPRRNLQQSLPKSTPTFADRFAPPSGPRAGHMRPAGVGTDKVVSQRIQRNAVGHDRRAVDRERYPDVPQRDVGTLSLRAERPSGWRGAIKRRFGGVTQYISWGRGGRTSHRSVYRVRSRGRSPSTA